MKKTKKDYTSKTESYLSLNGLEKKWTIDPLSRTGQKRLSIVKKESLRKAL